MIHRDKCLSSVYITRVRNNSGRAGEVFQWEKEENPIENCEKPFPSTEMKVFEVFFSGRTRIIPKPELFLTLDQYSLC
jgi:hypothetical protein